MAYIHSPLQVRGPSVIAQLIEKYGLNDPWPVQFWRWLTGVFTGKFGFSTSVQQPVLEAIFQRLPATVELVLFSIVLIFSGGIVLGVVSAVYHNRFLDHATRLVAIGGWSMPSFVLGLFMLMIFYGKLKWFYPTRLSDWAKDVVYSANFIRYTGMNTVDALLNGRLDIFVDAMRHLAMPVLTLTLMDWAALCRLTRSSMLEALRQDYVSTARAKGLAEKAVIFRHVLRNALLPTVTFGGLLIAWLLGGVVITETVFEYEGIGSFAAAAAQRLDFPGILGFAMFFGGVMVIMNLIVDLLYAVIDPRIRLD